jgi:hypothetical protein
VALHLQKRVLELLLQKAYVRADRTEHAFLRAHETDNPHYVIALEYELDEIYDSIASMERRLENAKLKLQKISSKSNGVAGGSDEMA